MGYLPYPERTRFEDLTPKMIELGEGFALMTYLLGGFVAIPCYIASQVLVCRIIYLLFNEKSLTKKRNYNWWAIILTILSITLPFLFFWIWAIFIYCKREKIFRHVQIKSFDVKNRRKLTVAFLSTFAVFYTSPLVIYGGYLSYQQIGYKNFDQRKQDLEWSYTLSEDKPNTLVLYADRSHGSYMSKLLTIDYMLFNKNTGLINQTGYSFAELFPEFTFYVNTLSQGAVTNVSNPSIKGSWNFIPELKNFNVENPVANMRNSSMTNREWFLESYVSLSRLFNKYNYNNLSYLNDPYYESPKPYQKWSDSTRMQKDLRKELNSNTINVFDEDESIVSLGYWPSTNEKDTFNIINELGASKNKLKELNTSNQISELYPDDINTNKKYVDNRFGANDILDENGKEHNVNLTVANDRQSSMIFFHSYITHQPYIYPSDPNYVSKYNPSGVNFDNPNIGSQVLLPSLGESAITSNWYFLQKLKQILIYLKNLPYTGPNSDVIKNQYDNTNIYIISDHGQPVFDAKDSIDKKMMNFIYQNKYISKEEYDSYLHFLEFGSEYYRYNNIFFRKPRKYKSLNENKSIDISKPLKNLFNTSKIVTLSDLGPIIESDLMKVKADQANQTSFNFNPKDSIYNPEGYEQVNIKNNSKDTKWIDTFFKGNLVLDPLNDANEALINKRTIPLMWADWRYNPNAKRYITNDYIMFYGSKINWSTTNIIDKSILNTNFYTTKKF